MNYRALLDALASGTDPVPQVPDAPEPPYRNPPSFPLGKPWVLSEDEWQRFAEAGFPESWEPS